MPLRCRERQCRKRFNVRTGTVMEGLNLDYQKCANAIYLHRTSLMSVSSMKLHSDLKIGVKSAWHLAHRLREAFDIGGTEFSDPVEADETYIGGIRKNMPKSKRKQITGRGAMGKTAVLGAKDRGSNEVRAKVVSSTDAATLQGFARENTEGGSMVYTDEASAYSGLAPDDGHEAVKHGVGEYVRGQAHKNGIELFRSMPSGRARARSTRSDRSIWTATSPSLRASTSSGSATRLTRWQVSSPAWSASKCVTTTARLTMAPCVGCGRD